MSGAAEASKRHWTLAAARALLPEIRDRTARAREEVDAIQREREQASGDAALSTELEQRAAAVLSGWMRAMEALGVEVKGAWLVDFDNGEGYYCWRDPEPELEFFHGHDEGFADRVRIQ